MMLFFVILCVMMCGAWADEQAEASLDSFPNYVEQCCQVSGHPPGYSIEQVRSNPGQRPPPAISEEDACVFLCALRAAHWVDGEGRMSPHTVSALAENNPHLVDEKISQDHVRQINEQPVSPCQRSYYFARYGYYLYDKAQQNP